MELGRFDVEVRRDEISDIFSHITGEAPIRVFQICERYGEEEEDEDHWYYDHAVQLAEEILNTLPC